MTSQTVTILGYGANGDGVARLDDGRVVFVRNAARGDILEVKLVEERSRSARAEIIRILTPSPYRIESDCPYYPLCGGCDFRHITYEEELYAKQNRVNDALARIGGLSIRADEVLQTGQTVGYRNKAVFHSDGISQGFYQSRSHNIIPVKSCLLLKDDINDALKKPLPFGETTLRSGRHGLCQPIEEELDGLVFTISGFFQVNTGAALLLYRKAREYAALVKSDRLIDMYCGIGSLTLFTGQDAGAALGVEINRDAVNTARENATRNGMAHIEFLCADAAGCDIEAYVPDCIIVDPPRSGLSSAVICKILALSPKRIVYVSCDPATLARDLRKLMPYTVNDICVVDMFTRTANVECCCLLEKEGLT